MKQIFPLLTISSPLYISFPYIFSSGLKYGKLLIFLRNTFDQSGFSYQPWGAWWKKTIAQKTVPALISIEARGMFFLSSLLFFSFFSF